MDSMAQPSGFEPRDAEILAGPGSKGAPSRTPDFEAVEYGSGWYHEAAIVESEQSSPQKH